MFDEYTYHRLLFATHFRYTLFKEVATGNWFGIMMSPMFVIRKIQRFSPNCSIHRITSSDQIFAL